ncbi:CDP-alcohol phosphatidyltransferase family protein [Candidatus Woesearchaeota archaeon]|nr:CDP-alcohol phosphatidyltransferase family protein [Candidatus Woesearchaeota archaeon]
MKRVNLSITAKAENALLDKLVKFIPEFAGPDALTLIALLAAIGIGTAYFFAPQFKVLYLAAAALYFVHWFGDSLDGRIARIRKTPRPNYGHYVDHVLDGVSAAVILGGLTASGITLTAAWLWVSLGFLLLMIHAFLKASVTGSFELSLGPLGPTEARLIGAGFSVLLFFAQNPVLFVFEFARTLYPFTFLDVVGTVAAAFIWIVLIVQVLSTARVLDKEDRAKWS